MRLPPVVEIGGHRYVLTTGRQRRTDSRSYTVDLHFTRIRRLDVALGWLVTLYAIWRTSATNQEQSP